MAVKTVTPFVWFGNNAEDAAKLYVTLFENSRICYLRGLPPKVRRCLLASSCGTAARYSKAVARQHFALREICS